MEAFAPPPWSMYEVAIHHTRRKPSDLTAQPWLGTRSSPPPLGSGSTLPRINPKVTPSSRPRQQTPVSLPQAPRPQPSFPAPSPKCVSRALTPLFSAARHPVTARRVPTRFPTRLFSRRGHALTHPFCRLAVSRSPFCKLPSVGDSTEHGVPVPGINHGSSTTSLPSLYLAPVPATRIDLMPSGAPRRRRGKGRPMSD